MDKALKQRLVGASVLVALAVVVLPMLLSGGGGNSADSQSIDLPPKPPELSFETRRFPIGDQASDQPSVLEAPAPDPEPVIIPERDKPPAMVLESPAAGSAGTTAGESPERPEPIPTIAADNEALVSVDTQTAAAENAPVTVPPRTPPVSDNGRYMVQVASFSGTGNADRLAGRLRDAGLPVQLDQVDAQAGRLHRVRVGPYLERVDADAAMQSINARVPDLNPRLIDLRPDETSAVVEPGDPLVRWAVQVGSFGDEANAEKLVFDLRDAGYRASSVPVTSGGQVAYKVRVGPLVERAEAVRIKGALKQDLSLDGLVMSTD